MFDGFCLMGIFIQKQHEQIKKQNKNKQEQQQQWKQQQDSTKQNK